MPIEVKGVVLTRNTVRITFRSFTWNDLQASADWLTASLYKNEGGELVAIPALQNKPVGSPDFYERAAGEYVLLLRTENLSAGEYHVVFEGEIDGGRFYEPVPLVLTTLKETVKEVRR